MEDAFDSLWLLGSYPSVVSRTAIFKHITSPVENSVSELFGLSEQIDVRKWLQQPAETPDSVTLEIKRREFRQKLLGSLSVQEADTKKASAEKIALCMLYAPAKAGECAKALEEILGVMSPKQYSVGRSQFEVSRADLIEEIVFSDTSYHKAAHDIARELVTYVDSGETPADDFVTLVKRSFEKVTNDRAMADDKAWKFIGAYSVLGAEMGNNFRRFAPEASTLNYSCYVMASALQVLDARMHGSGRLFTVPVGIKSNIDTGKPYHLLMSAFLTRELLKKGYSETAATTSTWLAQVGYQMLSKTRGREPVRAFMVSRVDYANLKIRFDLVNAASGIRYGVASAKKYHPEMNLSIDEMFKVSFRDSEESPLLSLEQAEKVFAEPGMSAYLGWTKIFQPKSIFFTAGLTPWYMGMGRTAKNLVRSGSE